MSILLSLLVTLVTVANAQTEENFRFYSKDKTPIIAFTESGKSLKIPSGSRFTQLEPNIYMYYSASEQKYKKVLFKSENLIKEKSPISSPQKCLDYSDFKSIFVNESLEALYNSKLLRMKERGWTEEQFHAFAPNFDNAHKALSEKLKTIINNPVSEQTLKLRLAQMQKELAFNENNPVETMNKSVNLLKKYYAPKGFHENTEYIPLSYQWFMGHSELKTWYEKHLEQDIGSPFRGGSGEGIVKFDNDNDPESYYNQMIKKLKLLQDLVMKTTLKNEAAKCGEQSLAQYFTSKAGQTKWLLNLNLDKPKSRLIFIHDDTWNNLNASTWSDYIPTDQSIGCFPSSRFLSTLAHEANVNSYKDNFFGEDTHAQPFEVNTSLEKKLELSSQDSRYMKSLVAREPHLQTFYLQMILN